MNSKFRRREFSKADMALMPQPRSINNGEGWLHVKGRFRVEWLGYRNSVLDRAVLRLQSDIARRTGLDVGRASNAHLRIECRGEDKGYLTIDAHERYSLAVKDDAVVVTADGVAGVLRGLATLRQSITNVPGGFAIPAMAIDDAPRFVWRGLMIDVARHFYSLPTLKRHRQSDGPREPGDRNVRLLFGQTLAG